MDTKTCFKCGKTKPLSDFYTHKQMADGHLGKCKDCTRADTRNRERTNPKSVLQSRLATHSKAPTKRNACRVVDAALRAGELEKSHNCALCNCPDTEKRIEAHHYDYSKPLDVTWLCPECHYFADQMRRKQEGLKATPRARAVIMMKDGSAICRFDSIADAARSVGRSPGSISNCLCGISKTCAGFEWSYEVA